MTKKENQPDVGEQSVVNVETAIDASVVDGQVVAEGTAVSVDVTDKFDETEKKSPKSKKKPYVSPVIEIVPTELDTDEPKKSSDEEPETEKSDEPVEVLETVKDEPKEKKRGRRAKSRGGPSVMSIDERRTVETDADKAKNDLIDLMEALKANKIMKGIVQGVEQNFQGKGVVAVLYHGVFKIVIPAEDMLIKSEAMDGKTLEETYQFLMTARLGSEIDFVINSVFYDDMVAYASRLDAMKMKRKRFYRGGESALVHDGVRAEARVVSGMRAGILIDLFGVEAFIPNKELSYQRIGNAMTKFNAGDRVIVKVISVDSRDMNEVKIVASVKDASLNPYEAAFKKYSVGNRYVGTVSMVDKNGVFVALDGGVDCLCRFPARGRPLKGARATVQILGIDQNNNRIWGIITHATMAL